MDSTYLVVAGLCVAGVMIRTGYERLKLAGNVETKNRAIFAVVFVAMCVMLASWPAMCPLDPRRVPLPAIVRWIGVGAVTTGVALAIGGLVQLRGLENIDHLVTTGLYSRLGHPMYAGFLLWIAGWIVAYGAVVSLAVGVACIGNVLYWRRLEERALESSYGDVYWKYRRGTWF
jgi:protein-S-isoprenylcysteine O-methyltransferase Ste14